MNIKTLLPELKKLVTELSEDLLARSTATAEIDAGLREAYTQIEKGGRTAQAYEVWLEDYLDQVAVAWVLGCVFVRFMEDNGLIDECYLAGTGNRRKLAEDTHEIFFREHPRDSDREYFEHVFREVGKIPACVDLFAKGKTPLWVVGPSGDAAIKLLEFWREIDAETGELKRGFNHETHETHEKGEGQNKKRSANESEASTPSSFRVFGVFRGCDSDPTRFLGDLYQGLSERARKKYALLQTPVFVEEFILDRTLDPALDEFGLETVRMIDPTCGSGHFLLGGFERLFDLWCKQEENEIVAAQKALDGVWGVDINPFAVAIARFRLIVAALQACNIQQLKKAPGWNIHLATGDSLIFGSRWSQGGEKKSEQQFFGTEDESWAPEIYACEDQGALSEVLGQQYHVVVGNPPYITVKDKSLNQAYRDRYSACHRQYSLAVPFMQRFFDLAVGGETTTKDTKDTKEILRSGCGYVGQITANSFMKREFGKKLITEFFPKIDLTHVIDTSGAYIPGHGTPTVILFGRNRRPQEEAVRAVLGIKGEPSTPADPAQGLVWQSILRQIDIVDAEDEFTSTADVPRSTFYEHPWSMQGGGASRVKEGIESHTHSILGDISKSIGFMCITKQDDVFAQPKRVLATAYCETIQIRPFGIGEDVRDWMITNGDWVVFPYNANTEVIPAVDIPNIRRFMWPFKTPLWERKVFGGQNYRQAGKSWYEYGQIPADRLRTPLSIAFAFVATHNHFVLDRGGKVFKQSAPIIKLPEDATEEDHLGLLGLLNSSTACFWMKQTFHNKGSTVDQHGARQRTDAFEDFYEYTGTGLKRFPVTKTRPLELAQRLDTLAREYSDVLPEAIVAANVPTLKMLEDAECQFHLIRRQMIALQEELDWQCYELYGLINHEIHQTHEKQTLYREDLFRVFGVFRGCSPGQRAFEFVMARQMAKGELTTTWFDRHGSTPITELPEDWPEEYRRVVQRRMELIETDKQIRLLEKPEYKRRWNTESWEDQQQRALRGWLLDRLESEHYWPPAKEHDLQLLSVAKLADQASGDEEFLQVAALYRDQPDFDLAVLIAELVGSESVPILPSQRYKPGGLRKRAVWEKTWELQRSEDAGEEVGDISVPPKYGSADFLKSDYWRLRGKLDVAKERWVSYPNCETDGDPSLVVGWAGWNQLEQATALVSYYDSRKQSPERLTPLLAGLDQLLPWIHQWHPEIDPEYDETAGTSFQTLLESEAQELGITLEDIRAWKPPAKKKGGKPRKTRTTRKKKESTN